MYVYQAVSVQTVIRFGHQKREILGFFRKGVFLSSYRWEE